MRFLRRPQAGQIFQPWMIGDLLEEVERLAKLTGDASVFVSDGPEGFVVSVKASAAVPTPAQLFIGVQTPTGTQYPWIQKVWQSGAWTNGSLSGTPVTPPSAAPTVSNSGSGGTIAAGTYYVVFAYSTATGPTNYSAAQSTTTTGTTSSITVNAPASPPTGATAWLVYVGTSSSGPFYQQGSTVTLASNDVLTSLTLSGTIATDNHLPAIELNTQAETISGTLIVPAWLPPNWPSSGPLFQLDTCPC